MDKMATALTLGLISLTALEHPIIRSAFALKPTVKQLKKRLTDMATQRLDEVIIMFLTLLTCRLNAFWPPENVASNDRRIECSDQVRRTTLMHLMSTAYTMVLTLMRPMIMWSHCHFTNRFSRIWDTIGMVTTK